MMKLLTEAATLNNAAGRAITYAPRVSDVKIYPGTDLNWFMGHTTSELAPY